MNVNKPCLEYASASNIWLLKMKGVKPFRASALWSNFSIGSCFSIVVTYYIMWCGVLNKGTESWLI